jgi:VanZ family protein
VIRLWLPVVLLMGAIYVGAALPETPATVASVSDTLQHMGGYAALAMLSLRATAGGRWSGVTARTVALAFAVAVIHGMTVEWEQMYIPSRVAEWRDVGNDAIGAAAGLIPLWAWSTIAARRGAIDARGRTPA